MLTTKILITVAVVCGNPELNELNGSQLLHELRAVVTRAESIYEYFSTSSNLETDGTELAESAEHQLIAVELVETTDDQHVLNSAPMLILDESELDSYIASDNVDEATVESAAATEIEVSAIQESEPLVSEETESALAETEPAATEVVDTEVTTTEINEVNVEEALSAETEMPLEVVEDSIAENSELAGIHEAWPTLDQQTRDAILLLVRADRLVHTQQ